MSSELAVTYASGGQELTITEADVRNYICPAADPKEIKLFLEMCAARHMNPYLKEAHLIKYGDNPATIVTGKDYFTKTARQQRDFRGLAAGVTVVNNGRLEHRPGSLVLDGEQLVGGWCKVFVEGYEQPMFDEVSFAEYAQTRYDYKTKQRVYTAQWAKMPGTMIRKVAIVHALREAFPEAFGGLYDSAEMGVEAAQGGAGGGSDGGQAFEVVEDAPDPRRELMLRRIEELNAQCVENGVKPSAMNEYMAATFGTTSPAQLDDEQLVKLGKHLAVIAHDSAEVEVEAEGEEE